MATHLVNTATEDAASATRQLGRELGLSTRELRNASDFVVEYWWPSLCRSANNERFWDCLFEKQWFNDNGVLDIDDPKFQRIMRSLIGLYAYGKKKQGKNAMKQWDIKWDIVWAMHTKKQPFIRVCPNSSSRGLDVRAPILGWVVGSRRSATPQKDHSPWEKVVASSNSQPSFINKAGTSDSAKDIDDEPVEINIREPKIIKLDRSAKSSIGNEEWALIDEEDLGDID